MARDRSGVRVRVVVIGDIGVLGDMIHIGDEAMFEAAAVQLRARGATQITAISANPAESAARYGVDAVAPIGFGGLDRTASEKRMASVIRLASGDIAGPAFAPDDPARAVIDAVAQAEGVLIAGGGNMSSVWPMHIYERATLGAIAAARGIPLVITGQTIGPELTADDERILAALLSSAAAVGVRESASLELCRRIGVTAPLHAGVDDASFLVGAGLDTPTAPPYCVVTLANHIAGADREQFLSSAAALLDYVAEATGLAIVFFAHFASLNGRSAGDSVVHEQVLARMASPASVAPTTDARAAAHLARNASLVVTSRYHPAVFAAPAGVPVLGIAVDEYTTVKLTGALGNFGQSGVLPLADLLAGHGPAAAMDLWEERDSIRTASATLAAARSREMDEWMTRVANLLGASGAN